MSTESSLRRVLVTGAGSAPAMDLIRLLQQQGLVVVAADANPWSAGLLIPAVIPIITPPITDVHYESVLVQACRDLRLTALISMVEQELPKLIELRQHLDQLGVLTWLPPQQAAAACVDKAEFAAVLSEHRIPTPATWLPDQISQIPPRRALVVKPRRGQGGQDVHFCADARQARVLCELVPDPLIQQRVSGREFTADVLVDRDGCASVILRERLLIKYGLAAVAKTFHDSAVSALVTATLQAIGFEGVGCVQGFITPDGQITITEANARFAGGFLLAQGAGADLLGQYLNGLLGRPVDHGRLAYRPDIYLTKQITTLACGVRDETCPPPWPIIEPIGAHS